QQKPSTSPLPCRSSAPLRKPPPPKPSPLRSAVGAAPRCESPHTISTPETTNPPCRRVCHIKGSALQLRTGLDDGFGHIELLEVLDEQAGQIPGRGIVGSRVSPGVARVQQLAVDTLNGLGHVQVDDRDVLGLGT